MADDGTEGDADLDGSRVAADTSDEHHPRADAAEDAAIEEQAPIPYSEGPRRAGAASGGRFVGVRVRSRSKPLSQHRGDNSTTRDAGPPRGTS